MVVKTEGKTCEKPSKFFTGGCVGSSGNQQCEYLCRRGEGLLGGSCKGLKIGLYIGLKVLHLQWAVELYIGLNPLIRMGLSASFRYYEVGEIEAFGRSLSKRRFFYYGLVGGLNGFIIVGMNFTDEGRNRGF
ncbi:Defensin-like protein [Senna tora]|uniref:Defensin-like protein n=1 Tax=Senna tora TaxID=362788 RepID=A0A834WQ92_9FABA|nr:Defensin-like protein [Senna tora]